jgi:hypothetical protein
MGSLGLHADPDGWLNAGYSVRTLMDSLDSELYDADRIGGAGLSQSWAGPVAEAFTGHWSGVRSRAEDLIAQGRRAAAATTDFGGRLEDFVRRAADLESYWLSFGLQLGLDGMHFALPWGFEQLSPGHQVSFHQWLTESERDVTAMWSDISAAVDDVVTALESLISALEDYTVLDVGALSWAAWSVRDYFTDTMGRADDILSLSAPYFAKLAADAKSYAGLVSSDVDLADPADQPAAADMAAQAGVRAGVLGNLSTAVRVAEPVALVGANLLTLKTVMSDKNTQGWRVSLEENAGIIAGTVTGDAITVFCDGALPGLGPIVGPIAGGIVAAGVGFAVQEVVDHRKAVGHALTDVGHGIEDAAGLDIKGAKGLAKLL